MKSKQQIAAQFKKDKGNSDRNLAGQWTNTRECQSFYAGDFMSYQDSVQSGVNGRNKPTIVQFNKVKPYVNAVTGFMAQNRRKAQYVARVQNDEAQQQYSSFSNAFAEYVRENANADQIETHQDRDMLICGYGAIETAMSYGDGFASSNPNGEILMGRLDPRALGWDSTARATNLLDARYVWYKKVYNLEEAKALFNDSNVEDYEQEAEADAGNKVYYKRGGIYDKIQEIYDYEDQDTALVRVYFYQWYDIEKYYRAKNPLRQITDIESLQFAKVQMEALAEADESGLLNAGDEIVSCDAATKAKLEELFEGYPLEFESFNRKVYYSAVISGTHVFTAYRNIDQGGFTIKFKTGDYDEQNRRWVGMVNSLKEPALYYNKALTELLYVIASSSKGGKIVERSAVQNIKEFESNYAKTDAVVIVEDGGIAKMADKRQPYQPTGVEDIIQIADNALPDVAGIDKTFLGSSENRLETATLQRQRIKQVTTTLATYFDAGTLYQKEHAKMLLPMMKTLAENSDGSMFKSFAPDGKVEFMTISPDNFVDDYDIIVREAPDTATQREERATIISNIADKLLAMGDTSAKVLYLIALKDMGLDYQDYQSIVEVLQPKMDEIDPAYVQQLEKQVQSLMSEGAQAALKKTLSEGSLNMVKVEEVIANIKAKNATAGKTEAETDQTMLENVMLQNNPPQDGVNVSI